MPKIMGAGNAFKMMNPTAWLSITLCVRSFSLADPFFIYIINL
jgi:hypothetical protein